MTTIQMPRTFGPGASSLAMGAAFFHGQETVRTLRSSAFIFGCNHNDYFTIPRIGRSLPDILYPRAISRRWPTR